MYRCLDLFMLLLVSLLDKADHEPDQEEAQTTEQPAQFLYYIISILLKLRLIFVNQFCY